MGQNREFFRTFINIIAIIVAFAGLLLNSVFREYQPGFEKHQRYIMLAAAFLAGASAYMARKTSSLRNKQRVFIIYSHHDLEAATKLVKKLRDDGFNPWFDKDEITPGQRIDDAIGNGILQSRAAILLVSKHTTERSRWVNIEITLALNSMPSKSHQYSPIIPVQLDDQPLPKELEGVNSIKWNDDKELDRLTEGLHIILGT